MPYTDNTELQVREAIEGTRNSGGQETPSSPSPQDIEIPAIEQDEDTWEPAVELTLPAERSSSINAEYVVAEAQITEENEKTSPGEVVVGPTGRKFTVSSLDEETTT